MGKYLFYNRIQFAVVQIPSPYKDVSDAYDAGHEITDLPQTDGLTYLATVLTDEDEFKTFAYMVGRYADKATVCKTIQCGRSLRPGLDESPTTIRYTGTTGINNRRRDTRKTQTTVPNQRWFLRIRFGAWRFRSDDIIFGYVQDELGIYATGGKLPMITRLIRTQCLTTKPFDKSPVWNFINGTLELTEPYTFREHRPEDLCTMQMDYPYDPKAYSREWNTFIEEIANHDRDAKRCCRKSQGTYCLRIARSRKSSCLPGNVATAKPDIR